MPLVDSIILGVVEGITEFLPISSTGHLILAGSLLHIVQSEFVKTFEIVIQLGAICAVIALYWKSFLNIDTLKKVIVAFIPTGIIGLTVYKLIKAYLLGNDTIVIIALFLGGIALIAFEFIHEENESASDSIDAITYTQAICIGLFQSVAIIPGVSRSAASIVGGLIVGIRRATIVEFSFLLAVPTMLAASGFDLLKTSAVFTGDEIISLGVGFVVAGLVAFASIRFLLGYIRSHTFIPFGIYRILAAVAFFLVIIR